MRRMVEAVTVPCLIEVASRRRSSQCWKISFPVDLVKGTHDRGSMPEFDRVFVRRKVDFIECTFVHLNVHRWQGRRVKIVGRAPVNLLIVAGVSSSI